MVRLDEGFVEINIMISLYISLGNEDNLRDYRGERFMKDPPMDVKSIIIKSATRKKLRMGWVDVPFWFRWKDAHGSVECGQSRLPCVGRGRYGRVFSEEQPSLWAPARLLSSASLPRYRSRSGGVRIASEKDQKI